MVVSVQKYDVVSPQYRPRMMNASAVGVTGVQEVQEIETVADDGEYEIQTLTCPATAAATQADYVVVSNKAGDTWAFWLDIDAAGTPPTGAAYLAADNQVMVSIATGDTAAQVAAALFAVAGGVIDDVTVVDNLDGTITLTSDLLGPVTNLAPHNEDDSGAGSFVGAETNPGVDSSLQSSYFLIDVCDVAGVPIPLYVWINVGGEGVDPAVPDRTGLELAIDPSDSANDIATALEVVLETVASATVLADVVTVTNNADGAVDPAVDGAVATGFTFTEVTPGVTAALALGFGKYDMTIEEGSALAGHYIIRFNEPFIQPPQCAVMCKEARAPRIVDSTKFLVEIKLKDLSGNPADSDFDLFILGSQARDLIGNHP